MKKFNLIKRLFMDSHEKQSPQRFFRYAAMLIMLLTLGVGQMWALDIYLDITAANWPADGATIKLWPGTGSDITGTSVATNLYKFTVSSATGTMYFKRMNGSTTWNEASVSYNSSYNLYKLTGWNGAACSNANISTATKTNYIYFDNSVTNWSNSYKYFVIGHDYPSAYSKVYSMSALGHTKLWYVSQSSDSWTDLTYYAICSPTSSWSGTSWGSSNISNANKYAAPYKGKYDMNNGSSYLFTPASSSNNCALTIDYKDGYSALNYSQTVKKYTSTDGGSTYSAASINSGTVTITPYKLTNNGTVSNSSNTGTLDEASETSVSKDAVYTGEVTVTASANSGYTFVGWFTAASGGSAVSTDASYTYNAPKSTNTIYARFKNETTYTITIANSVNASTSTVSVGATPVQITAPNIDGYEFSSWSAMPSGVTKTSGELTDESIYISATKAATVTANYTEDLSTTWYICGATGTNYPFTGWGTSGTRMSKKTGHSTEEIYYCNITVNRVASGNEYEFQTYNHANTTYYGYNNKDIDKEHNSTTVYSGNPNNMRFKPYVTGTYEFKLDNTGANPVLTVTWPVFNQVRISAASPTDATNTNNFDLSAPVSNVRSKTLSLNAGTTYTFKIVYDSEWYGKNSGAFTRSTSTSSNSETISADGGNMTLTTDYAGDYTFKFNESTKALSVDFPEAYKVTYGKGTVDGSASDCSAVDLDNGSAAVTSNSTWVKSGHRVILTAPTEATGYSFDGWFDNNSGTGDAITTAKNCTITVSSAETYYACYHEHKTSITITTDGHGTITTPSPNASPYSLGVATTQAINATPNTGYNWNRWTVSGTAALGTTATNASNTAKGNGTEGSSGIITATFTPKTTTITLNNQDATTPGSTEVTATFDAAMPAITLPEKTGYTFGGYWGAPGGSGPQYYNADGSSAANWNNENSTYTLFAKWTAKTYTVTLDYDETNHGDITTTPPTGSITATYDAAMPAIAILPKAAEGYAFMGYYSAAGGSGTQYYDGTGASVTNWNVDDEITLYAYYKQAEITSVTFDYGIVEPGATITATANIDPDPAGTTTVCWRLLHDNGNEYTPQPTFTPASGATVSFRAPETSTFYKVEAKLRTGNDCSGGTLLDTETGSFQVAGSHTVTVYYKNGANVIKASTSVTANPLDWSGDITAPDIFGYTFSSWSSVDGVTIKDSEHTDVTSSEEATIKIKATYNGSLTANYTPKNIIYFKDNLEWTDPEDASAHIYLNLLTGDYWNTDNGTGNEGVTDRNLEMSRVPGTTDIFYYDYGSKPTSNYVSFTKESMNGYTHFYQSTGKAHVVFPSRALDALGTNNATGLGFYAATPMFVPLATQTPVQKNSNHAEYYNDGYWTKYLPGTGYSLDIYQSDGSTHVKTIAFTSADELMPMKVVTDLEGGHTYKFQLKRDGDVYYGNSGTMTYEDHGQNTPWDFFHNPFSKCSIVTNAAGNYTFNLSYSPNSGGTNNRLRMSVDYPVADGDYRLLYSDAVQTKPLTSAIVNKVNDGSDTVSFFVRPGSTPVLRIQQASIVGSTVTWKEYPTIGMPTNQIAGAIATALTSGGTDVYNFNLSMNGSGALSVASVEKYEGNYYIRTDAANSKWDNYRTDPDHRMTYSEYSIEHGGYTHYYTHWVNKDDVGRKNVKFVIANDYSPNISDTLTREEASGTWTNIDKFIETGGDLKRSANVRFMWDKRSNAISRAYVDGAQGDYSSNFLYMLNVEDGADKIQTKDATALTDHKVTFKDNGNWMYEANIKAQPTAQIKLLSNWGTENTITQYFRGASDATETLLGGSGSTWYDIRVIYDFKTNRLIAGLIPSGTIDEQMAIHADVMFIREHHGDIAQLTFAEKDSKMGAITDIETAYGVLQLNKWTLNNKSKADGHAPLSPLLSQYERDLFYISFPFRVSMEEVFGFGTYGQHWIIEEYDGASRAANGYWQESGPNWKFVFNRKNKFFEPGTGYIIALDLDEMGERADIWANTDQVELYFPSYGTMDNITSSTATYNIPAHECTINRSNEPKPGGGTLGSDYDRRVKDSHWNVLGVPTYVNPEAPEFANTDWITTATETSVGPNFLYEWNKDNNTVTAVSASGYRYHAMHAYLVQYYDEVTWTSSVSVTPPSIVARRTYEEAPKSVEFRLELTQNDVAIDQTFVKLSDNEAVTTGFEFNYDLSKEFNNNKSNIYTLIGTEQVAGNVLPLTEQTTVVPVGVKIATNGDYTFSMPDGTEGIGVTLIDNETGIRTSLSALDYTVFLEAGTYDGRFIIEISPLVGVWTNVENVQSDEEQSTKARKMIIDQQMYIIKDGKMFDARGAVVK